MLINNLYFWINNIFFLLINLQQVTLDFFFDRQEFLNSLITVDNVTFHPISTPILFETFKSVINSFWDYYQHGLGFVDIENITVFILVIRFIFLSKKYNIKTGFFITCIGLGASYLWYMHLRDLAYYYMRTLWMCPLTHNLAYDFSEIYYQQKSEFSKAGTRFDSGTFYGPAIRAFTTLTSNDNYRYDPISMLWSYLPSNVKFLSDKVYYFITLKAFPQVYRFIDTQITNLSGMLWYTFIVRINKRYCPYLLRWHWTFLIGLEFIERPFIFIQDRLIYYLNNILIPNSYFREAELVTNLLITLVAAQYIFIILGMLHALCGQYFYFPFLTENTELHIGLRPKDSLYSGGHTIWQNKRAYMISRQASSKLKKYRFGTIRSAYSKLPRLWYGWLGRGTLNDMTQDEYDEYLKTKENKVLIQKAKRRDSKIRWEYRQERLLQRFIKFLAKLGIKVRSVNRANGDDDFYDEFTKFSKK
jgi:hypothetical protein